VAVKTEEYNVVTSMGFQFVREVHPVDRRYDMETGIVFV
jgi:hypothetical protein